MYETDELGAMYFLVAKGYAIRSVRREGRFCYFAFDPEAQEAVRGYWNNEAVPIQDTLAAMRIVRGRMRTI
jgi:hypothetical protein